MLRISKLTDYGTVIMAFLASNSDVAYSASDIAQHTRVNSPTVSKILKLLARAGLLTAHRGNKGGYQLAIPAEKISLAQILYAIEGGEIALTECGHSKGHCAVETLCAIRSNWRTIGQVLRETLQQINLYQMIKPLKQQQIQHHFKQFPQRQQHESTAA